MVVVLDNLHYFLTPSISIISIFACILMIVLHTKYKELHSQYTCTRLIRRRNHIQPHRLLPHHLYLPLHTVYTRTCWPVSASLESISTTMLSKHSIPWGGWSRHSLFSAALCTTWCSPPTYLCGSKNSMPKIKWTALSFIFRPSFLDCSALYFLHSYLVILVRMTTILMGSQMGVSQNYYIL